MEDKDKGSAAKAGFIGAAIGAVAGVVAGVFALAPKSAKENREDAKRVTRKYKNEAERLLADVQLELKESSENLKAYSQELKGKAKTEAANLRAKVDEMSKKVKAAIENDDVEAADSVSDAAKQLLATVAKKLK